MGRNITIINKEDKTKPEEIKIPICATYLEDSNGNIIPNNNIVTSDVTNNNVIFKSISLYNEYKIKDMYYTVRTINLSKDKVVKDTIIEETITIPDINSSEGSWLLFLTIENYNMYASSSSNDYWGYRIVYAKKINKINYNIFKVSIIIKEIEDSSVSESQQLRLNYIGVKI